MKKKLLEFAIIHWHDAVASDVTQMSRESWQSDLDLAYGIACGWVVKEDKKMICVATDYFYKCGTTNRDDFRSVSVFPKSGISKIVRKEYERF